MVFFCRSFFKKKDMILRLIIGIYIIGCICVIIELVEEYNNQTNFGVWFSIMFVISQKATWKYALQSWYFIHRIK